jgi:uncharacterized OB-fold protein
MTDEPLIFEQQISLPYVYTAGAAQRAALTGLREGRIVASHGGGHTVVPARPFAPDGTHLRETVTLSGEGTIESVTVAHHRPGAPAYALIRLDGATTLLFHRLGGGAERLGAGARVTPVWRDERTGSVLDIDHFAPA